MNHRRMIMGLAGVAAVDFALGSLVQTGVIERLPDPPIPGVDSHAVMTSPAAYPFGIPDAPIALALNLGVSRDRLLVAAVLGGAVGVVRYAIEMVRLRRACAYCIVAGAAMLAMVPLALRGRKKTTHS
jgi:uncharacterized membrane protein